MLNGRCARPVSSNVLASRARRKVPPLPPATTVSTTPSSSSSGPSLLCRGTMTGSACVGSSSLRHIWSHHLSKASGPVTCYVHWYLCTPACGQHQPCHTCRQAAGLVPEERLASLHVVLGKCVVVVGGAPGCQAVAIPAAYHMKISLSSPAKTHQTCGCILRVDLRIRNLTNRLQSVLGTQELQLTCKPGLCTTDSRVAALPERSCCRLASGSRFRLAFLAAPDQSSSACGQLDGYRLLERV